MRVCIFISDEGFGHIVRQRAIISELLKKKISVRVVSSSNLIILKEKFENKIEYFNSDHIIKTVKDKNGSLSVGPTKRNFKKWFKKKDKWVKNNIKFINNCDFIISDFVPSAFKLAHVKKIPAYGVCHFTWDWFYKKIFGIKDKIYFELKNNVHLATKVFFPPFTFKETLKEFRENLKTVNFILTDFNFKRSKKKKKKQCLVMDNGNNSLRGQITKSLPFFEKIKNIEFILRVDAMSEKQKKFITNSKNLIPVSGLKNTHEKILEADFLIARGGFNTISECLVLKKPSMLFYEKRNPEVKNNLETINNLGYTFLINNNDCGKNLSRTIKRFNSKYNLIKKKLDKKKYKNSGALEIVNDILKNLGKS